MCLLWSFRSFHLCVFCVPVCLCLVAVAGGRPYVCCRVSADVRCMFSVVNQKEVMQQEVACSQCDFKQSVTCYEQQEQYSQLKPLVRVIGFKQSRHFITTSLNNACLLLAILYLCVILSSLRSCRSCKFNSRSACFSTSQQQRSHYLLHLLHLHHLHNGHQSTQYSGARPQLTLQLRGNHHQHHKAGLHWWVVSERTSMQR